MHVSGLAFFYDGGTTIAGSDADLLVLDGDSFTGVTDTCTSTRLTLVNAGGDGMEIRLFQTKIVCPATTGRHWGPVTRPTPCPIYTPAPGFR